PQSAGARERFGHLFQGMVRFHADHPIAFHFLEIHHHVYLDEHSRELYADVMRFLTGFLEETRAAQITRPLPAVAIVAMILGAFTGMVKAAEQDQFTLSPEVIAETERACWAAIANESQRNDDRQSGIERIES
ncbi:MAG: hypothetical protein KDK30_17980, partial [Leptospiraceae bacterium]|nr:hypothetical protein [Leptospiraceae bacterium]